MTAVARQKRNALFLFAGCILSYTVIWTFLPGLSVLQWLGNVLMAVGAINLAFWLCLVRFVPEN